MAEQYSPNDIPNFEADWYRDETYFDLPFSGGAVQKFIKDNALLALNERVGAAYFDSNSLTMFFFADADTKQQWIDSGMSETSPLIVSKTELSFSGNVYQFQVKTDQDSNIFYFTQQQTEMVMNFHFVSRVKSITDISWTDTGEDATLTIQVDSGNRGEYSTIVSDVSLQSGETYSIDMKRYLVNGSNRVKVVMHGVDTLQTSSVTYMVNLTSMYLDASNLNWWTPFIEGEPYVFGGMIIGGAVQKTLHIRVRGNNYSPEDIEVNLGTSVYVQNEYFFRQMQFPTAGSGIYSVEIWVSSNTIESSHYTYNIMCVAAEDTSTVSLVVANNFLEKVINGNDNNLFDYAVYNKGLGTGNIEVNADVRYGDQVVVVIEDDTISGIAASQKYTYSRGIDINLDEAEFDMNLSVEAEDGNQIDHQFLVDNAISFPAVRGASFIMSAVNRSNGQSNKTKLVNESDYSLVNATWTDMTWVDGTDGWTVDDEGRKCLLIPAGARLSAAYNPLTNVGNGKTIEFTFKVSNVADFDESIIRVLDNDASQDFRGIRISPNNITIHSNELKSHLLDSEHGYNFKDEELVNVIVSITQNYKVNYGNLAQIFVNGVKKCQFEYSNTDIWDVATNLSVGADASDVYLYSMRVYDQPFGSSDAFTNYVASLPSYAEKIVADALGKGVIDDSWNVDYDKVAQVANVMTVEITREGDVLPAWGLSKEYATRSNLEIKWHDHPEESFKIFDVETSGQGTTSMNYFRWNLRFRIDKSNSDKKCNISYWNTATNNWGPQSYDSSVRFDGNNHTPILRITAKKNFASSMQSHKMGSVAAFNDLHDAIVGANEAEGRVATFMEPVYAFQKIPIEGTDQYAYQFIGLFTVGPDKGDKPTFGYNNATYKNTIMSLEGVDHDKRMAQFKYPWNNQVTYKASEEALCIKYGDLNYEKQWEASNFLGKSTDKETDESAINSGFARYFKPAYEVAYKNSTYIKGTDKTLAWLNEHISEWENNRDADTHRLYSEYEFWLDGAGSTQYNLYYHDVVTGRYEYTGINMLQQYVSYGGSASDLNGKSTDEKNALFIAARKRNFAANWTQFWHKDDCIFCFTFLLIFGASDNFVKNSYPYNFGASGNKWRWRQDDLDTIFDIDNQGRSKKSYSIEFNDWIDSSYSGNVFRGSNSVFWTLIFECCANDITLMGQKILQKMYELGSGQSVLEKLMSFFYKYYWGKAQNYFTKTAYNSEAEYSYEDAWKNKGYVASVDTHPLAQSLGDHLEAEKRWVELRMVYVMSMFQYGPFSTGSADASLGRIGYRPLQTGESIVLTPAIDLYPCILMGQSGRVGATSRVKAGESITLVNTAGSDTNIYIQAVDYLASIGDLCKTKAENFAMLQGKRLQEIKLGDEDPDEVTSNITSAGIGNCPALVEIDARNLGNLTGTMNLEGLTRLRRAYFGNTGVTSVLIKAGSKITVLDLPASISTLILKNLQKLSTFTYESLDNVALLWMEDMDNISPFEMLDEIFNLDDQQLQNIRITGFTAEGDSDVIDMLTAIKNNEDKDGNEHVYHGIDSTGMVRENPVLAGELHFSAIKNTTRDMLMQYFEGLNISTDKLTIGFEDLAMEQLLISKNWDTNHDGMLDYEEMQAHTSLPAAFAYDQRITKFNEMKYTRIYELSPSGGSYSAGVFEDSDLEEITFPDGLSSIRVGYNAFYKTPLKVINWGEQSDSISIGLGAQCFGRTLLEHFVWKKDMFPSGIYSSLDTHSPVFYQCDELKDIFVEDGTTALGGCEGCPQLTTINIPSSVTQIGRFDNNPNLVLDAALLTNKIVDKFSRCGLYGDLYIHTTPPRNWSFGDFSETNIESIDIEYTGVDTLSPAACNVKQCRSLKTVKLVGDCSNASYSQDYFQINENFSGCSVLESVDLGGVTIPSYINNIQIASSAFDYCYKLASIKFPAGLNTVSSLGSHAFRSVGNGAVIDPEDMLSLKFVGNIGNYSGDYGEFYYCKLIKEADFSEVAPTGVYFYVPSFQLSSLQKLILPTTKKVSFPQNSCSYINNENGLIIENTESIVTFADYCFYNTKFAFKTFNIYITSGSSLYAINVFAKVSGLKNIVINDTDGYTDGYRIHSDAFGPTGDIPSSSIELLKDNRTYGANKGILFVNNNSNSVIPSIKTIDLRVNKAYDYTIDALVGDGEFIYTWILNAGKIKFLKGSSVVSQQKVNVWVVNSDFVELIGSTVSGYVDVYQIKNMRIDATTPPAISRLLIQGDPIFWVPDSALAAYQSASMWNQLDVRPVSEMPEGLFDYVMDDDD